MKSTRTLSVVACGICLLVLFFASIAVAQDGLGNPLNSNFSSIPGFIAGALKALALIALPIISLFLVISGFLFLTAQGNQQKLDTAKKNFFFVIIGAVLILGAWVIATLIAGTVSEVAGSGNSQGNQFLQNGNTNLNNTLRR